MISVANLLQTGYKGEMVRKEPLEAPRRMIRWTKQRSLLTRILLYAVVATLAFVLAAGLGAMVALALRGDLSLPRTGERQALDGREDDSRAQEENDAGNQQEGTALQRQATQQEEAVADRERVASRLDKYIGRVGEIQVETVETFLKSHEKILQYDALTAEDVDEMQANEAVLERLNDQADGLTPPRRFKEQYEVFSVAIDELHEAARLAHGMAADPVAAAELGFDEYDSHVNEASALLQRSNKLLDKDYKTIEGVREISPEF
jgi:hypothetical protein